jgi:hypothetical protein
MEVIDPTPPMFPRTLEFYTASNFTKVIDQVFPSQFTKLVVTENGLFSANDMTRVVKHVSKEGVVTTYDESFLTEFKYDQGVVVQNQMTKTVHTFHQGVLINTYTNKTMRQIANNAKYGSAFLLNESDGSSFAAYGIDLVNGITEFAEYNKPISQTYTTIAFESSIPYFRAVDDVTGVTTAGYYNHGWKDVEVQGDFDNGFNTFITLNDVNYAITLEALLPLTEEKLLVKAYNGTPNNNTVFTTTITGINIFGIDYLGETNGYLILTLNDADTRKGTSLSLIYLDKPMSLYQKTFGIRVDNPLLKLMA